MFQSHTTIVSYKSSFARKKITEKSAKHKSVAVPVLLYFWGPYTTYLSFYPCDVRYVHSSIVSFILSHSNIWGLVDNAALVRQDITSKAPMNRGSKWICCFSALVLDPDFG